MLSYSQLHSKHIGNKYTSFLAEINDVCGNRRGQPRRKAIQDPHPGINPFGIRFTSRPASIQIKLLSLTQINANSSLINANNH